MLTSLEVSWSTKNVDFGYPRLNFQNHGVESWHPSILVKKWKFQKSSWSIITWNWISSNVGVVEKWYLCVSGPVEVCQDCVTTYFWWISLFLCTFLLKLLVRKYDAWQIWKILAVFVLPHRAQKNMAQIWLRIGTSLYYSQCKIFPWA